MNASPPLPSTQSHDPSNASYSTAELRLRLNAIRRRGEQRRRTWTYSPGVTLQKPSFDISSGASSYHFDHGYLKKDGRSCRYEELAVWMTETHERSRTSPHQTTSLSVGQWRELAGPSPATQAQRPPKTILRYKAMIQSHHSSSSDEATPETITTATETAMSFDHYSTPTTSPLSRTRSIKSGKSNLSPLLCQGSQDQDIVTPQQAPSPKRSFFPSLTVGQFRSPKVYQHNQKVANQLDTVQKTKPCSLSHGPLSFATKATEDTTVDAIPLYVNIVHRRR